MLNYTRYISFYWVKHQWSVANKKNLKFYNYYLNLFSKKKFLKNTTDLNISLQPTFSLPQKPISLWLDANNYFKKQKSSLYVKTNFNLNYCVNRALKKQKINKLSTSVRLSDVKHNLIQNIDFMPYWSKQWRKGYNHLSFFVKKTFVYEKNRRVKKYKLVLKVTQMYNFFKNALNSFYKQTLMPKHYVYLFFLKKKYKFTINFILKRVAEKINEQQDKPIVLRVPYIKR